MLRFRSWAEHNRRIVKDVQRKRGERGVPQDKPLALERVILSSRLDLDFAAFAEMVGGRCAESFFVRALQYAATHDGVNGTVQVSRAMFGPIALSTPWDLVSSEEGAKVYDALLATGICVPFVRAKVPDTSAPASSDVSADVSADKTADVSADSSADKSALVLRPSSSVLSDPPYPLSADVSADKKRGEPQGGGSASPTRNEPAATSPELSTEDRAVIRVIVEAMRKSGLERERDIARRVSTGLRDRTLRPDVARAFVDEWTPSYLERVQAVRRTFAMARNGRNGHGRGSKGGAA